MSISIGTSINQGDSVNLGSGVGSGGISGGGEVSQNFSFGNTQDSTTAGLRVFSIFDSGGTEIFRYTLWNYSGGAHSPVVDFDAVSSEPTKNCCITTISRSLAVFNSSTPLSQVSVKQELWNSTNQTDAFTFLMVSGDI